MRTMRVSESMNAEPVEDVRHVVLAVVAEAIKNLDTDSAALDVLTGGHHVEVLITAYYRGKDA